MFDERAGLNPGHGDQADGRPVAQQRHEQHAAITAKPRQVTILGGYFSRYLAVMLAMGKVNSFKVANIFHIAAQKGNVEVVLADLEKWAQVAYSEPPADEDIFIQREVETRRFFDGMYARYFMPDVAPRPNTQRIIVPGESTQPPHQLILPSGLRN